MMKKRIGIASAGNWILDITKIIDVYPEQDTLANIQAQSSNNGGAPYNLLKDLSRMKASFPLFGMGLVGQDEPGQLILNDCHAHGIDTEQLRTTPEAGTSYTDVMLVKNTGRRTFFHYRGANALFDLPHVDLDKVSAKILHLGYLLLLDKMDEVNEAGQTHAALLLEQASRKGFVTSVDLVSEHSDRFRRIILPSLPHIDILFCNEYEAGKLSGMMLDTQDPDLNLIRKAIDQLLGLGVRRWIILHFPEGCVAGSKDGDFIVQGSVCMPSEKIVGATGAGDAFAAGTLYGIHEEWSMTECLRLGVCCAAASLTDASCSDGIEDLATVMASGDKYGYRKLNQ